MCSCQSGWHIVSSSPSTYVNLRSSHTFRQTRSRSRHLSVMGKTTLSLAFQPFSQNVGLTLSHCRTFCHNHTWDNEFHRSRQMMYSVDVCFCHQRKRWSENIQFYHLVALPMAERKLNCGCLSYIKRKKCYVCKFLSDAQQNQHKAHHKIHQTRVSIMG